MDELGEVGLLLEDHDYFKCTTSEYVIAYVGGFVARKASRFAQVEGLNSNGKKCRKVCPGCTATLSLDKTKPAPASYKLIQI